MMRIKIPFGGVTPEQLETLADLSEEYADGVSHVTTRQDFQFHYVHIDDTPALMRRLAAVGHHEPRSLRQRRAQCDRLPAGGNLPRETFDTTPYAKACAKFLMGHPDTQDFGRKVKVAFSGCEQNPCGLVTMHDMGAIAKTRSRRRQTAARFRASTSAAVWARCRTRPSCSTSSCPKKNFCRPCRRSRACSPVWARSATARGRGIKFLIAQSGHR